MTAIRAKIRARKARFETLLEHARPDAGGRGDVEESLQYPCCEHGTSKALLDR